MNNLNNNELVNEDGKTLDELIEEYRNAPVEFNDWHEYIIEDWTEKLEALGYEDPEIMFSGFWCQGDGAGFTPRYDIDKFVDNNKPLIIQWLFPKITDGIDDLKNWLSIFITHTGNYYHKHSYNLNIDVEGEPEFITEDKLEEIATELECILEEQRLELCNEIYEDLQIEYEYLTSDEYIKEWLIGNDLWKDPGVETEPENIKLAA